MIIKETAHNKFTYRQGLCNNIITHILQTHIKINRSYIFVKSYEE